MKTKLTLLVAILFAALFPSACATTPTMKSLAGVYEGYRGKILQRTVLLENGKCEWYKDGVKQSVKFYWRVSKDGELHIDDGDGGIGAYIINSDGSFKWIKKRFKDTEWIPVDEKLTLKKIA